MADLTIIPTIRKSHEQHVSISDTVAVPISSNSGSVPTAQGSADDNACLVCHKNQARYTCPQCEIPYCSLECYKAHDDQSSARSCTESFYQSRVVGVMNLEAKQHKSKTQRLLQNVYHQLDNSNTAESYHHDDMLLQPAYSLSQEDLLRILKATEQDPDQLHQLISSMAPEIQQSIDHAIQHGQLQQWILKPWHPWWKPELVAKEEEGGSVEEEEEELTMAETLDERLLEEVPSFLSLRSSASADLRFNLVDVLHAILSTLTLYHGVDNASCHDNCLEAAQCLIQASRVLSQDARYTQLEQVLMEICSSRQLAQNLGGNADVGADAVDRTAWSHDLCSVCSGFRLTARALLEGIDILQNASSLAKARGEKESRSHFKRVHKKMVFLLSWSRDQNRQMWEALGRCIEDWFAAWDRESELDPHLLEASTVRPPRVLVQEVDN